MTVPTPRWQEEVQWCGAILDSLPDMVYVTARDTMRFVYVNELACRNSGYSRDEHLQIGPHQLLDCPREDLEREFDKLIDHPGGTSTSQFTVRTKSDKKAAVEVHRRAVQVGERWLIVSVSREVSQRLLDKYREQRISRMYAALSATNEAIMHARSPDQLFDDICAAAVNGGGFLGAAILVPLADGTVRYEGMRGVHADRALHMRASLDDSTPEGRGLVGAALRTLQPCISHDFQNDERTRHWHAVGRQHKVAAAGAFPLMRDGRALGVLLLVSADKRGFHEEIVTLLERMAQNVAFALENIARDEEKRASAEQIQYLASHDALTGLPNRMMFAELLSRATSTAARYERGFALMFVDLDHFKLVNDTLGHASGDQLLKEVSQRLVECVRASDVVARIGGDEFVILLQEIREREEVSGVAQKLLSTLMRPLALQGYEYRVTGSVGISLYPTDATEEQGLMRCADMAMYQAKEDGRNSFQFFMPELRTRALERLELESKLRGALERHEFSLHYQPKVDVCSGRITGVEALLRWMHPAMGDIAPARFIPLAEETGFIVPIGRWVLRTACAQCAAWQHDGLPPLRVAVNVSSRQFADDSLVNDVADALHASGIPAGLLELEISERSIMVAPEYAFETLDRLKQIGVRVAIDDFGTGYASLSKMRNFRVDTLKIDRTFIREIPSNPEDRAIADAILSIGQSLSIDVVAEGVETLDQLRYLRSSSCDQLQGWYFSKALPPDDLARLWKSGEHIGANHLRQLPSDPMAPGAGVETDGSLRLSD